MGFRMALGSLGASVPALGLLLEVAPVLKVRGRMFSVIKLDPMTDKAAICSINLLVYVLEILFFFVFERQTSERERD